MAVEPQGDPIPPASSRARQLMTALLALLLALGLVAGVTVWRSSGAASSSDPDLLGIPVSVVEEPQPLSGKHYKDAMAQCIRDNGSVIQTDYEKFQRGELSAASMCILSVFFEAADRLDMKNIVLATSDQVRETPGLYMVCHDMAHRAAKRAYVVSGENARLLLEQVPFTTCDDGFVHGIFDAVAHIYGADGQEFKDVIENCVLLGTNTDGSKVGAFTLSQCGDGSGHVLYVRTGGDLLATARLCADFQEPDIRRWCVMGAMMERYKPYFSTWTMEQQKELVDNMARECSEWPEDLQAIDGAYQGCWSAAGYLFNNVAQSRTAQILTEEYAKQQQTLFQESGFIQPERVKEPARSRILAEYATFEERCSSFPADGQEACFEIAAPLLPVPIRQDKGLYEELCREVMRGEGIPKCVNSRLWGVGAF